VGGNPTPDLNVLAGGSASARIQILAGYAAETGDRLWAECLGAVSSDAGVGDRSVPRDGWIRYAVANPSTPAHGGARPLYSPDRGRGPYLTIGADNAAPGITPAHGPTGRPSRYLPLIVIIRLR
jgi:hypothetical protein